MVAAAYWDELNSGIALIQEGRALALDERVDLTVALRLSDLVKPTSSSSSICSKQPLPLQVLRKSTHYNHAPIRMKLSEAVEEALA